jgi:orotate phosphoribosyltransferase
MDVKALLIERGCVFPYRRKLDYHFIGSSGAHLGGYANCDPILWDVTVLWWLTGQFAALFGGHGQFSKAQPQVVVAPAIGAIPLAHLTAIQLIHELPTSRVDATWGDKVDGPDGRPIRFVFKRPGSAEAVRGKRVLLVDDMITDRVYTSGLMIQCIRQAGGRVVGMATIAATKGVTAKLLDIPAFAKLCEVDYPLWTEAECWKNGPCSKGVPIVVDESLGKGFGYRQTHPGLPSSRFVNLNR